MNTPDWITEIVPRLTDEELVQLADALLAEMNQRTILADQKGTI
jgi:hypothetical protein